MHCLRCTSLARFPSSSASFSYVNTGGYGEVVHKVAPPGLGARTGVMGGSTELRHDAFQEFATSELPCTVRMMAAGRTDMPCSHLEAWGAIERGRGNAINPKILKILPPGVKSLLPGVTELPPNKTGGNRITPQQNTYTKEKESTKEKEKSSAP